MLLSVPCIWADKRLICLRQGKAAAEMQWVERLPERLVVRLQRLAVCLADDREDSETLLLEAVLEDLDASAEHSYGGGTATITSKARPWQHACKPPQLWLVHMFGARCIYALGAFGCLPSSSLCGLAKLHARGGTEVCSLYRCARLSSTYLKTQNAGIPIRIQHC